VFNQTTRESSSKYGARPSVSAAEEG